MDDWCKDWVLPQPSISNPTYLVFGVGPKIVAPSSLPWFLLAALVHNGGDRAKCRCYNVLRFQP